MAPPPSVTGLSPSEGAPGTKLTIRGEFLGSKPSDLIGLTICGFDCLLSAEWLSPNKIIARTGAAKGKGDIIVTTFSGGVGSSTVQFRAYYETIGPMKESAVWIEESPIQSVLAWGRRSMSSTGYSQGSAVLGLSIEENDKKFPEDLRELFPDGSGDLSALDFSPGWFLLEHHHATSFEDLRAGLSYLRRKVESQKDTQLSFLKSNVGSVIDQLDTLMTLRDKVTADVEKNGQHQVKDLEVAIQKSIDASHNLFNDVLTRREKADSTRNALAVLNRYKFLFCLPNTIERLASKNEFDIISSDYARAKNLFGNTDVPIFKKVLDEVDEKILGIRKSLHDKIREMPQGVEQQKKLVKSLINLDNQQAGTVQSEKLKISDPAWAAIETRSKYLEETFKTSFNEYLAKETNQGSAKSRDTNLPPNRVMFCEEMTEIATGQIPDLWRLGQAYFLGELRGANEPKPGNFKQIILNAIERYCCYLRAAVLPQNQNARYTQIPSWPMITSSSQLNLFITWLPTCLRYMRVSYASLIRLDLPNEALDIVSKIIDELRLYCLSTILKKANEKVKKLHEKETWEVLVSDFPGATLLPSKLEEIMSEALEEGQQTCLNPEIREGVLLEPTSEGQREVSKIVQDMLKTFCDVVENLATERSDDEIQQITNVSQMVGFPTNLPQSITLNDKNFSMSAIITWEHRLLCCLANSAYCNKIFFLSLGNLFLKFNYPIPKMAIENSRSNINLVFGNLLDIFVEHKSDPLVGTIEPSMYIGHFQWDTLCKSDKLSPYAHECCDNIIGVYSEIFAISPFLLRPILEQIVQTVAEELSRLMACVTKFNANGALQANIDIKLIRDAVRVYSNERAKSFFNEALDSIPKLSEEGYKRVDEILAGIKKNMKLQVLCLQVINP